MGSFLGSNPKAGPSADEIRAREKAAAAKERARADRESSLQKASEQAARTKQISQENSRRRAFAGQLAEQGNDEDDSRKRYLKAV